MDMRKIERGEKLSETMLQRTIRSLDICASLNYLQLYPEVKLSISMHTICSHSIKQGKTTAIMFRWETSTPHGIKLRTLFVAFNYNIFCLPFRLNRLTRFFHSIAAQPDETFLITN
jgi:hypothetical protein